MHWQRNHRCPRGLVDFTLAQASRQEEAQVCRQLLGGRFCLLQVSSINQPPLPTLGWTAGKQVEGEHCCVWPLCSTVPLGRLHGTKMLALLPGCPAPSYPLPTWRWHPPFPIPRTREPAWVGGRQTKGLQELSPLRGSQQATLNLQAREAAATVRDSMVLVEHKSHATGA